MNSTGLPDELSAEELARLQARAALLHLPIGQVLPQPQPTVIVPDKSAATFLPRWAVQVLVGPALTYRQLSNPLLQSTSLTSVNSPAQYTSRQSPTNIAELERPALGTGAQANVRRSLTEHWTVSAGLGYSEYATRLALQQVRSPTTLTNTNMAPLADSSTTSIHTRDVYRFVTLPLRVGYTWTLTPRWRMGLLAGADVALYMGGSSTEGSPCACQAQAWGASNSPYRRVSLGASLGVEMRYRLNGRWELLAQPTGTYLLTPLAQSTTAYYRRHLLGGTALLGAAYTLP